MKRTLRIKLYGGIFLSVAGIAAGAGTAGEQSTAPNLDVVGIKLGMPVMGQVENGRVVHAK